MTDLDLVNVALTRVGIEKLKSLDDTVNSKVIQCAKLQLPVAKQATLRANDWNCARRRRPLALRAGADLSLGEWAYTYEVPSDCLAVRRFAGLSDEAKFASFSVEKDENWTPILFTNVENAAIVYTGNMTDVNRFDSMLFDACATRLGIEFCIAFPRELKFMEALWQQYKNKIEEAVGADEAEGGIEKAYERDMGNVRAF